MEEEGLFGMFLSPSDQERRFGRMAGFILILKDRLDARKEARKRGEDPDLLDFITG